MVSRLVFTGLILALHTNLWFQNHLKSTSECRRTEARLSTSLAAKGCIFLLNKKKLEMDWSKWMMMKRGKIDKQGESMVASYRYLGVSIRAYKWFGAISVMFPICVAPGPHSTISEEFLHSIILRPKKQLESCQPSSQY